MSNTLPGARDIDMNKHTSYFGGRFAVQARNYMQRTRVPLLLRVASEADMTLFSFQA